MLACLRVITVRHCRLPLPSLDLGQWRLGILSFLVATAYLPGLSGGAVTPKWVVIAIGPWLLIGAPRFNRAVIPFIVFLCWSLCTMIWSPQLGDAIGALIVLWCGFGVFCLGASSKDLTPAYVGFALGIIIASYFGWFGINQDIKGEAAAAVIIALIYSGIWLPVPFLGMMIWQSHSRGAILGLLLVVLALTWQRSWKSGLGLTIVGFVGGLILLRYSNVSGVLERVQIWTDTIAGINWFGHGLGSFWEQFPLAGGQTDVLFLTRPDHAHNDLLEITFEQGIIGGLLAVLIGIVLFLKSVDTIEQCVIIAILGMGLTGFPLHVPTTFYLGMLAMGRICGRDNIFYPDFIRRISSLAKWKIRLRSVKRGETSSQISSVRSQI